MLVKLKDICTIKSSKRIFEKEYVKIGVPFIRGKEIKDKSISNPNSKFECYISKERFLELKESFDVPKVGDILMTAVGTVGNTYYINKQIDFYYKDGNIIQFTNFSKEINSKYLYFFFNSSLFNFILNNILIGAVQKALTMDMLKEIEINLPPLEIQNKIVNILSNIDNQIERNNAMTKRLQVMILTRYSIMFQDKTNRNGLLKDICLLPSGHNFKPEIYNNYGKYKLITIKNVCDTFVDDINTDKISEVPNIKDYCYLNIGDILLSLTGNVGRISIVHSKNNLLNQRVSLLQAKENYKIYSYCLLKSQEYQFIMTNIARGTSQKNLSPIDVENLQIYMPTFEEIKAFNENTENYFNEMLIIKQSTESLIKLKNTLLPLLINGQLSV